MNDFNPIDEIEKSTLKEEEKNKVKKSYEKMKKTGYIIAFVAVLLIIIGISIGVILENHIIMLVSMIIPFIILFISGLLTKKYFPKVQNILLEKVDWIFQEWAKNNILKLKNLKIKRGF